MRVFDWIDGRISQIDWGGPISILVDSADEAIEGSSLQFEI